MSRRSNILGTVSIALMLFCVQVHTAQTTQTSNPDEVAIRQVVQQLQDGWSAKDGKAFAAPFASDADYIVVDGGRAIGREAIEKGHTGIFANLLKR